MVPQKLHAALGTAPGELLGEFAGIAAFVAGGEGAAYDMVGILLEGRLDLEQLVAADHAALHAVLGHQGRSTGRCIKGLLVHIKVGNAFFQPVVCNAGGGHDVFERAVAVGTQGYELLHIALKGSVVAVGQKFQTPAVLVPAFAKGQLRAKQQRCFLAEHPLQRLPRRLLVGPGFAVAHRNLGGVGKAGFHRGLGLAVHHGDLMTQFHQMPCGAHAHDARAKYSNFHAASVIELPCIKKTKSARLRNH